MRHFYTICISDYRQRTRSYAFLIMLAISLYAAYSFVPSVNATYTTVRVGNYIGVQNAAWIGYVTAMMTSVFLSLVGPFLINSSIKKDTDTGVGMIIATTGISNFNYLMAKWLTSFMVLLSITGCVFIMSIGLFFVRSAGYSFQPMQFVLPYVIITIPTLFFISALAIVGEVFLYRYTTLMNIGFFTLFCVLVSFQTNAQIPLDIFGVKKVTNAMQDIVAQQYHYTESAASMGFIFQAKVHFNFFLFNGISWTITAVLIRILWAGLGLALIFISSKFFHRFDTRESFKAKKKTKLLENITTTKPLQDIKLSALPPIIPAYGIIPFIKTELLMLIRKGPKWLWLINFGGMIALFFAPLIIAHQVILPMLWFMQVTRWSDLATKEKTNRIHYFTYASYKPLTRLLPAQLIAGIIIAIVLASPLLVKCLIKAEFLSIISIILGGIFVVVFSAALGILSGGKKLFEILFFLFTYANIERVPLIDYFGAEHEGIQYIALIATLIAFFTLVSFMMRKMEIRRL